MKHTNKKILHQQAVLPASCAYIDVVSDVTSGRLGSTTGTPLLAILLRLRTGTLLLASDPHQTRAGDSIIVSK